MFSRLHYFEFHHSKRISPSRRFYRMEQKKRRNLDIDPMLLSVYAYRQKVHQHKGTDQS